MMGIHEVLPNLIELKSGNGNEILNVIQTRYAAGKQFTLVGNQILIAVNSFNFSKNFSLETFDKEENREEELESYIESSFNFDNLQKYLDINSWKTTPHLFGFVNMIYRNMLIEKRFEFN